VSVRTMAVEEKLSHVWGTFGEVVIDDWLMSRAIRFYEEGRTSLHRHDVSEALIAVRGSLSCDAGVEPDALERYELAPGEAIVFTAGTWHSVGCSEPVSRAERFALAFEIIFGEIAGGKYEIERAVAARPSAAKDEAVARARPLASLQPLA
jgi:mannose-6-phosphate isomerase-like protein (cupin superfamily)